MDLIMDNMINVVNNKSKQKFKLVVFIIFIINSLVYSQLSHMFVNTAHINESGSARAITVSDDVIVYVANDDDGLRGYTYLDTMFIPNAHIKKDDRAWDIELAPDERTLFAAYENSGIIVYKFNEISFIKKAEINNGGQAFDIEVLDDSTVFLANANDGIRGYRYRNDSLVNILHVDDQFATQLAVRIDSTVFVSGDSLKVYKYKDDQLVKVASSSLFAISGAIAVDGEDVYTFDEDQLALLHYNFDGNSLLKISELFVDVIIDDIEIGSDKTIFLALSFDGIRAYKYLNNSLVQTAEWNDTGEAWDIFVDSTNTLFVANGNDGIRSFKYTDYVVSVNNNSVELENYSLSQNYPNPFNPVTTIKYTLPVETQYISSLRRVALKIYDILGNEITRLVNKEQSPGTYEVEFDGSELASGLYIYQLNYGDKSIARKMVLLK